MKPFHELPIYIDNNNNNQTKFVYFFVINSQKPLGQKKKYVSFLFHLEEN